MPCLSGAPTICENTPTPSLSIRNKSSVRREARCGLLFGRSTPGRGPLAHLDGGAVAQARMRSRNRHGLLTVWRVEEDEVAECGIT